MRTTGKLIRLTTPTIFQMKRAAMLKQNLNGNPLKSNDEEIGKFKFRIFLTFLNNNTILAYLNINILNIFFN